MTKSFLLIAASLLATPALAAPIDGTWVGDVKTAQLSTKPKVRTLDHGIYRCSSCVPAYAIPADGKFHPLKGDPYVDEQSVKVVDAHTVSFQSRQGGHEVGSSTSVVSPDGKTNHWTWKNISKSGVVTTGEGDDVRIAPGPKGAHLISGSWRNGKIGKIDAAGLTVTFHAAGGMFHMSAPTGESYDAKIGGPAVPIKNDAGGTMASVRQTAPTTWVETDTRKGKVVGIYTMHVLNPTTMAMINVDTEAGRTTRFIAHKK